MLRRLIEDGTFTRVGISVWGSRVLEVPGRASGAVRRVPVNLLTIDARQYLVSARGNGQWVRNVRANDGRLDLLLGRRRTAWVATELHGVDSHSTDDELLAIAAKHPVFALGSVPA